ncbi:uncharacterized protein LOC125074588 [Vanessa atalanta]|uniref:uncharacterized protein LOC125074588 n=1 Tax=Vanessa atalanta TaxID=42275 RepID=UPI001FCE22D3|nr:uncharacterized protein LOC125074588 [Vanessa atalanta]XP_047541895.1 uncharacterized protein LOC125074588 [Vanessa atalanta]
MALFMKQDFNPPMLSRRWIAIKFRPNMLLYSREHIISILESGLLFREDSVEVEQEAPAAEALWGRAGGTKGGWFTQGERNLALLATLVLVAAAPPRTFQRCTLLKLAGYAAVPVALRAAHRLQCRGALRALLPLMRDYTALVRRATACCREYATLHARLTSVTAVIESMRTMLGRQQSELLILMSRATSSLLGNVPWLHGDVACEFESENLMKIHHAFLVVQSTLLKYIAMAHVIPSAHAQKIYKNHNERIHWIHNILIQHLVQEFKENYEALERMYRLLKNYGAKDSDSALKKPGSAINDTWLYSDVHTGIARSCLELKLALERCSHLDMFLDSCAMNKQEISLDVLDKDIDEIIDNITKCLSTVQNSQIRLKKMKNKLRVDDEEVKIEDKEYEEANILKIEDKEPVIRDEVFYFVKTEDESVPATLGDIVTGPGLKEKETSKVVLKELQRKLVKREDMMRERERQALAKTMPELKNIPEFPRQIKYEEFLERKGFISKIKRRRTMKKLFKKYEITKRNDKRKKLGDFELRIDKYETENDITNDIFKTTDEFKVKTQLLTISKTKKSFLVTKWLESITKDTNGLESSGLSDGLSDVEASAENRQVINNNRNTIDTKNYRFTRKDLELSPSSSESDFDHLYNERISILNDVRRYRAVRKKNVPAKRLSVDNVDESLKPIEYSFGTGLAMASVLQINNNAKLPNMIQEEVFIGDGEVSEDSGNDEDA